MTAVAEKKLTISAFLELDVEEGYIYELLNGIIMRRTSPNLVHQAASMMLSTVLNTFILAKNLGRIYAAPTDVYLTEFDLVVPDLSFVALGNPAVVHDSLYVDGVPDLIIEILSKGTQNVDRGKKMKQYEANKVSEYWIVDPLWKSIEVYEWRETGYEMVSYAEESGEIKSTVLPEFELDIAVVFAK